MEELMRPQGERKHGNKNWRKLSNVRTLTPTRLKGEWVLNCVEEVDEGENKVQNAEKEVKRRDKRNQVMDQNRPNLLENNSSPNEEEDQEDDNESTLFVLNSSWDEEEEDKPAPRKSSRSNNMNDSLEYFQSREKWQKKSQISRRNSFNRYRKSIVSSSKTTETKSISKTVKTREEKTTTSYSNLGFQQPPTLQRDDEKFLSCVSLKASEFDSTGSPEKNPFEDETWRSPKKCASRNYITTNFQQVDRISDIFVKQRKRMNRDNPASSKVEPDSNNNYNNNNKFFQDLNKPVPCYVVIGMFVAFVALIYHMYNKD
ncbi:unnamed protein product [Diamesa serratosioi]